MSNKSFRVDTPLERETEDLERLIAAVARRETYRIVAIIFGLLALRDFLGILLRLWRHP